MTNDFTVQTAMPSGNGNAALSAVLQGAGIGLPTSWCTGAFGVRLPRLVDLGQAQVAPGADRIKPSVAMKPGTTKIPTNYNHMTRTSANGEGGSGSQPLREPPPA
jgi:hypothetical protein